MNRIAMILLLLCFSALARATPLRLDYAVSNLGAGSYHYDFSLVLDNHDDSWASGQGWGWFIFGDSADSVAGSPLTAFAIDTADFPVGPWTGLSSSVSGHNGPTFTALFDKWIPSAVGDTLFWSGTSSADLAQGQLLFSTLLSTPGAVKANFEVANRTAAVPEPPVMALLLPGLFLLGYLNQRRGGVSSRIVASQAAGTPG